MRPAAAYCYSQQAIAVKLDRPARQGNGARVKFFRFEIKKRKSSHASFMNTMFAAFLGGWEWLIVLLAVLLLFGAKKIPDLAKGLGQGIKEFKKAAREMTDEIQNPRPDLTAQRANPPFTGPSQPVATVAQNPNPPQP
jgi:sec-independent protein translocase protein TatA